MLGLLHLSDKEQIVDVPHMGKCFWCLWCISASVPIFACVSQSLVLFVFLDWALSYILKQGPFTDRLAGQRAPGIHLSYPGTEITDTCWCTAFYMSAGDLNSGPKVCKESTSLTEHLPILNFYAETIRCLCA